MEHNSETYWPCSSIFQAYLSWSWHYVIFSLDVQASIFCIFNRSFPLSVKYERVGSGAGITPFSIKAPRWKLDIWPFSSFHYFLFWRISLLTRYLRLSQSGWKCPFLSNYPSFRRRIFTNSHAHSIKVLWLSLWVGWNSFWIICCAL